MTTGLMLTREQAELLADFDHRQHVGKILRATEIDAFDDRTGERVMLYLDPPARVRVLPEKNHLIRWTTKRDLDPLWYVEPVEPRQELQGLNEFQVYGPTYCTDGVSTQPDWEVEGV